MTPLQHLFKDSQVVNDCDQKSITFLFLNQGIKQKIYHQKRKAFLYGKKDRSSALYKYIKEKQQSYLDYNKKGSKSIFSLEEDQILILLVKKYGPKFQKITRYFPGKTLNMLKNRYYKNLKNQETLIIPKEMEEELLVRKKQNRNMGNQIIKNCPEEQRISALIDNSQLFPEVKEKIQCFLQSFTQVIGSCMKYI